MDECMYIHHYVYVYTSRKRANFCAKYHFHPISRIKIRFLLERVIGVEIKIDHNFDLD